MKGRKPGSLPADPLALSKVPPAPRHLAPLAKLEWRTVLPSLVEAGTVRQSDLSLLATYCAMIAIAAEGASDHAAKTLDAAGFRRMNQAATTARQIAAEFGLTPVARTRAGLTASGEEDAGDDPLAV